MSIAEEHGKAITSSNNARLSELVDEIAAAGVLPQLKEYLHIIRRPESAFSERIEKRRKERNTGL